MKKPPSLFEKRMTLSPDAAGPFAKSKLGTPGAAGENGSVGGRSQPASRAPASAARGRSEGGRAGGRVNGRVNARVEHTMEPPCAGAQRRGPARAPVGLLGWRSDGLR